MSIDHKLGMQTTENSETLQIPSLTSSSEIL